MPDFEVELTIYDPINPRLDPLAPEQWMPDTHVVILVTADDLRDAENKAVAHIASLSYPPVIWERFDYKKRDVTHPNPNAEIEQTYWSDPARNDHDIWLNHSAELPPGDNPESLCSVIYDIRHMKHQFVRPNRRVAAENEAITRAAEKAPRTGKLMTQLSEAMESLAEEAVKAKRETRLN